MVKNRKVSWQHNNAGHSIECLQNQVTVYIWLYTESKIRLFELDRRKVFSTIYSGRVCFTSAIFIHFLQILLCFRTFYAQFLPNGTPERLPAGASSKLYADSKYYEFFAIFPRFSIALRILDKYDIIRNRKRGADVL